MTTTVPVPSAQQPIRTLIPARLDRLRWSPFHTRMVIGLGAAWILDGLNITVVASVSAVLQQPNTLDLSSTEVGLIATVYLLGELVGALFFGKMSDRLGRKKLFVVTLGVFLVGSGLTAFTFGNSVGWLIFFYATRFLAGTGIGGEYAAINSAIDEMMPSRYRGRVDVWINGTYWAGSILGTFVALIFLNAMNPTIGWHLAFLVGPLLAVVVILIRKNLPESPRWLVTHGHEAEANEAMRQIEKEVTDTGQLLEEVDESLTLTLKPEKQYGYMTFLRLVFRDYTRRAILAATLMITQSFLYNAIFFTYAIVLTKFYGVSATRVPIYGLAFAVGNLAGPLLLGHLFDSLGRKKMIAGTYIISGLLLALSGWMFETHKLTAETQTLMWIAVFFFASAGASAAYLTASEIFPIEIRAEAIAVFFAIATIAGALGPLFYGALIGNGTNRTSLYIGYLIGAGIMVIGGLVEIWAGVNAEGKSLETIARPLTAVDN
jgi:MFS family permease